MTVDVFLSYAEPDRARARKLASCLEKAGWTVWWDQRIPAGSRWRSAIANALGTTRCVIVLWSGHSVTSPWVNEEAEQARGAGKLVPILIDDVAPPLGFGELQCADLSRWNGAPEAPVFRHLVDDIEGLLGAPAAGPPASPSLRREQAGSGRWRGLWWCAAAVAALVIGGVIVAALELWEPIPAPEVEPIRPPAPSASVGKPGSDAGRPTAAAVAPRPAPATASAPAGHSSPVGQSTPAPAAPLAPQAEPTAGTAARRPPETAPAGSKPRCSALLSRLQLGEPLPDAERQFFYEECGR